MVLEALNLGKRLAMEKKNRLFWLYIMICWMKSFLLFDYQSKIAYITDIIFANFIQ